MSLRSPGRGLRNVEFPSAGCHPLFAATTLSTRIRTYSERIHFSPEYATEYAYLEGTPGEIPDTIFPPLHPLIFPPRGINIPLYLRR
eukprot:scaffold24676_cov61-Phaeocystis_antarctica.AAC.4